MKIKCFDCGEDFDIKNEEEYKVFSKYYKLYGWRRCSNCQKKKNEEKYIQIIKNTKIYAEKG